MRSKIFLAFSLVYFGTVSSQMVSSTTARNAVIEYQNALTILNAALPHISRIPSSEIQSVLNGVDKRSPNIHINFGLTTIDDGSQILTIFVGNSQLDLSSSADLYATPNVSATGYRPKDCPGCGRTGSCPDDCPPGTYPVILKDGMAEDITYTLAAHNQKLLDYRALPSLDGALRTHSVEVKASTIQEIVNGVDKKNDNYIYFVYGLDDQNGTSDSKLTVFIGNNQFDAKRNDIYAAPNRSKTNSPLISNSVR